MSRIKFGFVMPQGWRWLDSNGCSTAEQYTFVKETVSSAEQLGYDTAYSYDHLMGGANHKSNRRRNLFECFVLLSSLFNITSTIRFGQLVTCNSYRNPALLAKMISTMDNISEGRVQLGIGAGWDADEYLAFGYEHLSSMQRIQQLEEALKIIKLMYTQDGSTFSGKYYSIVDVECYPKPVQRPYPPIMVGGTGEKHLLRIAAKHANIYNHPFASPSVVQKRLGILKDHCISFGRDYAEIERSVVLRCLIKESEDQIAELISKEKNEFESTDSFVQRLNAIIGTPETVRKRVRNFIEIGIESFVIHFIALDMASLKLFSSEVMAEL